MSKVDELDRELATALRANPYITTRSLAQLLGVNEKTVVSRLDSLSSKNLLKVTTQWSMKALGLDVIGHLFIHSGTRNMQDVIKAIASFNDVLNIAEVVGWPSLFVYVTARDLQHFFSITNRILDEVPGISVVESVVGAEIFSYDASLGGGIEGRNWSPDFDVLKPHPDIDDFDFSLVSKMQADARISNREIARQLDVSESKVRTRFKKLVDGRLLRKATVVEPFVFDYDFAALIRIKIDTGNPEAFCDDIVSEPGVSLAMTTFGRYNVFLLLFGDSLGSVTQKIYSKLESFPESTRYSILPLVKVHKFTYGLAARF